MLFPLLRLLSSLFDAHSSFLSFLKFLSREMSVHLARNAYRKETLSCGADRFLRDSTTEVAQDGGEN